MSPAGWGRGRRRPPLPAFVPQAPGLPLSPCPPQDLLGRGGAGWGALPPTGSPRVGTPPSDVPPPNSLRPGPGRDPDPAAAAATAARSHPDPAPAPPRRGRRGPSRGRAGRDRGGACGDRGLGGGGGGGAGSRTARAAISSLTINISSSLTIRGVPTTCTASKLRSSYYVHGS